MPWVVEARGLVPGGGRGASDPIGFCGEEDAVPPFARPAKSFTARVVASRVCGLASGWVEVMRRYPVVKQVRLRVEEDEWVRGRARAEGVSENEVIRRLIEAARRAGG